MNLPRTLGFAIALTAVLVCTVLPDDFQDALKLIDAFKYKEAVQRFQQFIQKNPKDKRVKEAMFKHAEALLGMGSILQASSVYENIIKNNPGEQAQIKARLLLARCLEARGEFSRAIAKYKEYVR